MDTVQLLRLLGELRARLDAVEALVRGSEAVRPERPERAWCLPAPGLVRWNGEVTIPLRRWHLLEAILSGGGSADMGDIDDATGERTGPAFRVMLSRLNTDLEAVGWPVAYRLRGPRVVSL